MGARRSVPRHAGNRKGLAFRDLGDERRDIQMPELYACEGRVKLESVLVRIPSLQMVLLTTPCIEYLRGHGAREGKLLRSLGNTFSRALPRIAQKGALRACDAWPRMGNFHVLVDGRTS